MTAKKEAKSDVFNLAKAIAKANGHPDPDAFAEAVEAAHKEGE